MQRMGWVIQIRQEKIAEYQALHAAPWQAVLTKLSECGIRNYSIYLREPEHLLFGYFEYHGADFAADMAKLAEDETTQRWWALTDPCQEGLGSRQPGQWWAPMQGVFHHD